MSADIATPQNDSQYWTLDGDPTWTDYEGDTPYADSTMSTSTYALTQVNRFFGLAGEKDTSTDDESYRQGDLIGSTTATTDDAGATAVSAVSYTAFGELLDSNGVPGGAAPSGMPRHQRTPIWRPSTCSTSAGAGINQMLGGLCSVIRSECCGVRTPMCTSATPQAIESTLLASTPAHQTTPTSA